jgi:hypothetical protein
VIIHLKKGDYASSEDSLRLVIKVIYTWERFIPLSLYRLSI